MITTILGPTPPDPAAFETFFGMVVLQDSHQTAL